MLARCGGGFGAVAMAALLNDGACAMPQVALSAASQPHYRPKVRSVIFLYMDGGVSQMDSFDPKPSLDREHGQPFKMKIEATQFDNNGNTLKSPWKFRQYGRSGIPVSELFPHVAECVDDLAIIRSMTSEFSEHSSANYFLHTGHGLQGRPSMGAWVSYGLGNDNASLPDFVVLNGGLIPSGGVDCFGSGFLPASHQGSIFKHRDDPVANIQPLEARPELQQSKLDLLKALDAEAEKRLGPIDALESAIANYEMAFRMQAAVPELTDLSDESAAIERLYGSNSDYEPTRIFARECLLARRLVERGVRFIELTCPVTEGNDRWDAHSGLVKNHSENAWAVDQPIAGLLKDLKSRGLLDETLVVWTGEFGRTPFAQGADGRDHNPFGFSMWLAGGGVKGGTVYGATDEYGYKAVENRCDIHDLHATMLHLLGVDHTKLTFRVSGRDFRLTDVYGEVLTGILI
ncbi:MAG TPA: DUF1501 domain-containing protein [Lacipirellulaceae bacterium]|nr:DUF1501 domain-containing protein [Lacipirellulaceae bacterium]